MRHLQHQAKGIGEGLGVANYEGAGWGVSQEGGCLLAGYIRLVPVLGGITNESDKVKTKGKSYYDAYRISGIFCVCTLFN